MLNSTKRSWRKEFRLSFEVSYFFISNYNNRERHFTKVEREFENFWGSLLKAWSYGNHNTIFGTKASSQVWLTSVIFLVIYLSLTKKYQHYFITFKKNEYKPRLNFKFNIDESRCATHSLMLLRLLIRWSIFSWGHLKLMSKCRSSVSEGCCKFGILQSILSHTCSLGDRSGDLGAME